jgi:branched-chain amino acid transport system ATP-binding protein
MSDAALLEVDDLHAGYGRSEVLHGVSLRLREGMLCAVVGANGAGKTTLLLALARVNPIRSGRIVFAGIDTRGWRAHDAARRGLVLVPEGRRMLPAMSVVENLEVAAAVRPRAERRAAVEEMLERFPILGTRRAVAAGSLSGGEQQMLAFGRALAMKPRALLLDEPSMGLSPKLVDEIFALVAAERARGTTILLVEQNAREALVLADYAYVLERGAIAFEGSGADVLASETVARAYLGAVAGAEAR